MRYYKTYLRIQQTNLGIDEIPEFHEENVTGLSNAEILKAKARLETQMVSLNREFLRHSCDHNPSTGIGQGGCKLEKWNF